VDGDTDLLADLDLTVRKWDLIDVLRAQTGATTYAQIVTSSTSPDMLERPELTRFATIMSFAYADDAHLRDVPDAACHASLAELTEHIRVVGLRPDILFVDPWHSYEDSSEVIQLGFDFIRPGGVLVVHDCHPPHRALTIERPLHPRSWWCGATWRAFLDFTGGLPPECDWYVVDSDFGMGVVPKTTDIDVRRRVAAAPAVVPADLDADGAWDWLEANRATALRLVPPEVWRSASATVHPVTN